jgi:hypothetical protein
MRTVDVAALVGVFLQNERSTVETGPPLRNSGDAPQTGCNPAKAQEKGRQSPR